MTKTGVGTQIESQVDPRHPAQEESTFGRCPEQPRKCKCVGNQRRYKDQKNDKDS